MQLSKNTLAPKHELVIFRIFRALNSQRNLEKKESIISFLFEIYDIQLAQQS